MILHLGNIDIPYNKGGITTGDVADILERRYHVQEIFWEERHARILEALEETIGGELESSLSGIMPGDNAMAAAMGEIETMFHQFISSEAMNGIQPGVPTKAAQKGVNHRLRHPYAKGNSPRPSFRDTGTYDTSFKAWIEE